MVVHPDRKAQRALARLVGATSCKVDIAADMATSADLLDEDAIAIVDAGVACANRGLRDRPARAFIAIPTDSHRAAGAETVGALLAAGWDHVVAHPMPLLGEELLATIQKLLRDDLFGLDKYMAWGAEVRDCALTDACDRDDVVASLARDVYAIGLPDRIGSLVSVIADELIANAIYIAPVDERGGRPRAEMPRDRSIPLSGRDAVTARWATDGRYLAIEVRDHWGTIDAHAVLPRLASGGRQAQAIEGGMGLALAYACANQLVIGCARGKLTEVIALLDVRYKPTELGRQGSFHAFQGAAPLSIFKS